MIRTKLGLFILPCCLHLTAFAQPEFEGCAEVPEIQHTVREVRTTAYSHGEADHIRYGRKNALGSRLKFGRVRSAAADWSRYPVGTKFRIIGQEDVLYVVDDYGRALVGKNTIDLYKPTMSQMRRWGARNVEIEIVEWGCFEESLRILKPRARKAAHVRRMVWKLQEQV